VGPGNQWSSESDWKLGFIAFFIAWGQRGLSGMNRCFLGRRSVSLANCHLLGTQGPPAFCPSIRLHFIWSLSHRTIPVLSNDAKRRNSLFLGIERQAQVWASS
jgi:hypothetical protein